MKKDETGTDGISEAELMTLLASLKVEPAPEADFEARFLYDLRERVARESVCCPARRLLWDHIQQVFANFGPRRLAYGASSLGLGVLAAAFFALPGEPEAAGVAAKASPLSRLEHSLSSLRPNSGKDVHACTTITIGGKKERLYTESGLADSGVTAFLGGLADGETSSHPVNMGLEQYREALTPFPAFSTASGF